jgi:ParB-like chromosome segregation protein Spo0J
VRELETRTVPLSELKLDPKNARVHPGRNLDGIKASLKRFGQQKPIVVDSKGTVRAGNGTVEAALALGWKSLAVIVTNLSAKEAIAYAIADNRTTDLSWWDEAVLVEALQALDDDLREVTGFVDDELQAMVDAVSASDFSGLDAELGALPEVDEQTIGIVVPKAAHDEVNDWLANGEGNTARGRGIGVMKRCGLRS